MNKKLSIIIVFLGLLVVALFWALIFTGKDEFEELQTEQAEEIESPSRVTEKAGVNMVQLSPATQQNSGISTAKLTASSFANSLKSTGIVVAIDGLIEAKAKALSIASDANIARAVRKNNIVQYQRLKALNADDKNVSDKVVQDALALVNADKGAISASELQLKNLRAQLALQWGEPLALLASNAKLAPHLAALLSRKNVLVQVSLPNNAATPALGSSLQITPLNDSTAITANYVSPALQSDATGAGKTFYYSAPAELLRIGMRVQVANNMSTGTSSGAGTGTTGAIIPNSAVVWHGGKPWAYFKQGGEQFVRKPISTETEVDGGWFNAAVDANAEVVVSGAQLLLSEEFKYLIKNENED
jgi:hypothetical protein